MARNYTACKMFAPEGNGGYCTIHGTRDYPEMCRGFFCKKARERLAEGNSNPCEGCSQKKMREEGCCVGSDVGFGTKQIGIGTIKIFDPKAAANEVGPDSNATREQQESFWRRRM